MSLMKEYIDKKLSGDELELELSKLISEYNKLRGCYLFVYAAAISKRIPTIELDQDDYYLIRDLLVNKKGAPKLDFYIETPGGSGEAAEEIVKFLRNSFDEVSFVVSGEAKSAGTIMVLSGDDILMTETGSLGPIDAQITIGRSRISAYDYIEWVDEKRLEAQKNGRLNPFDAIMVAQITPGELGNVLHALKFAEDLVVDWLSNYKFKNWNKTETQQLSVTEEMKRARAEEIAKQLYNHSKWRLHGRSIKVKDLEEIKLKITKVEENPDLANIVYRIQTVCRLIFNSSSTYKIFATVDNRIFKSAVPAGAPSNKPADQQLDIVQIEEKCPKCGESHKIYGKFIHNPQIDKDLQNKGFMPFPKSDKIKCKCGYEIDLLGMKNEIELRTGRKLIKEEV